MKIAFCAYFVYTFPQRRVFATNSSPYHDELIPAGCANLITTDPVFCNHLVIYVLLQEDVPDGMLSSISTWQSFFRDAFLVNSMHPILRWVLQTQIYWWKREQPHGGALEITIGIASNFEILLKSQIRDRIEWGRGMGFNLGIIRLAIFATFIDNFLSYLDKLSTSQYGWKSTATLTR